jgi:hypothetical protein
MSFVGKIAKFKIYKKIFMWLKDWYQSRHDKKSVTHRAV